MVSVSDTRVMPIDAISMGTTSLTLVHGRVGLGNPCGNAPTVFTSRLKTPVTTVAPTTTKSTAGILVVNRGSTSKMTSNDRPSHIAVGLRRENPSTNARNWLTKPSASVENPQSLGNWPTMMVSANPFM